MTALHEAAALSVHGIRIEAQAGAGGWLYRVSAAYPAHINPEPIAEIVGPWRPSIPLAAESYLFAARGYAGDRRSGHERRHR